MNSDKLGEKVAKPSALHTSRGLWLAVVFASVTGLLAIVGAEILNIPLRDPEGFLGPSWVRLPAIIIVCLGLDVLPRVFFQKSIYQGSFLVRLSKVWQQRWPLHRLIPVILAVVSFYITYFGYRNLKNLLPFTVDKYEDYNLVGLDRVLFFGNNPAHVLHEILGTGVAAHILSNVYVFFLVFVPVSVAVALVWSKNLSYGLWYVTALCINWSLGAVSYYLVPASGPFAVLPWNFSDLSSTSTADLQVSLLNNQNLVLENPYATNEVSGIAAFASLHTSIVFTAALIVQLLMSHKLPKIAMWVFFTLTVTATIYFGWHYIIDDIAGVFIGLIAVVLSAKATGNGNLLPVMFQLRTRQDSQEDDIIYSS